jgi:hypothetical protein
MGTALQHSKVKHCLREKQAINQKKFERFASRFAHFCTTSCDLGLLASSKSSF